jgi:hypothetical protein
VRYASSAAPRNAAEMGRVTRMERLPPESMSACRNEFSDTFPRTRARMRGTIVTARGPARHRLPMTAGACFSGTVRPRIAQIRRALTNVTGRSAQGTKSYRVVIGGAAGHAFCGTCPAFSGRAFRGRGRARCMTRLPTVTPFSADSTISFRFSMEPPTC